MFQSELWVDEDEQASFVSNPRQLDDSLFRNGEFDSHVGKVVRVCKKLQRVRVYRNLNKPEYFSILAVQGEYKGKVVGYARSILLENCRYVVSAAGRQRTLRDRRKCVHAFCEGVIVDASSSQQLLTGNEVAVTYDPYTMGAFYCRASKRPVNEMCEQVLIQGSDVYQL